MENSLQLQIRYFTRLVNDVLNTGFVWLDRKLVPNEYAEHTLAPPLASKTTDELLFGGVLFECEPGRVHELGTDLGFSFSAVQLRGQDGFVVLGPYVSADAHQPPLEQTLRERDISEFEQEALFQFQGILPILSHDQLFPVLNLLHFELYGDELEDVFSQRAIRAGAPDPCPVSDQDVDWVRAEVLAARYEGENAMLERVLRGETFDKSLNPVQIRRLADPVRNAKNLLIIMNSLLRKNLEKVKIHPFYIDRISTKWALRIEGMQSLGMMDEMTREMLNSYSQLVRRHSMVNYTPNVRGAINYLRLHLTEPDLSLSRVAQELGINASYLSQQFNRETGKRLTQYLAELRVEKAKQLLASADQLSIGQIAVQVGFNDVNYFSHTFRKYTGQTPSVYRTSQKKAATEPQK